MAAAEILGNIGDTRAIDSLTQALRDENRGVRMASVNALGNIGDPRVMDHLIAALEDKDQLVRSSAEYALEKIKTKKNTNNISSVS